MPVKDEENLSQPWKPLCPRPASRGDGVQRVDVPGSFCPPSGCGALGVLPVPPHDRAAVKVCVLFLARLFPCDWFLRVRCQRTRRGCGAFDPGAYGLLPAAPLWRGEGVSPCDSILLLGPLAAVWLTPFQNQFIIKSLTFSCLQNRLLLKIGFPSCDYLGHCWPQHCCRMGLESVCSGCRLVFRSAGNLSAVFSVA